MLLIPSGLIELFVRDLLPCVILSILDKAGVSLTIRLTLTIIKDLLMKLQVLFWSLINIIVVKLYLVLTSMNFELQELIMAVLILLVFSRNKLKWWLK